MFRAALRRGFTAVSDAPAVAPAPLLPRSIARLAKGTVLLASATAFYLYARDSRAAVHRYVFMPLSHLLDPESSHVLAVQLAKWGLTPREMHAMDDRLGVDIWGKQVKNCIGLAAGFDKHAEAVDSLFDFGFGLVEIGSVTPLPQEGNPKPRMFRIPEDKAVINRYGFNSEGHDVVSRRLFKRIKDFCYRTCTSVLPENEPRSLRSGRLLGINLGKNKMGDESDYLKGVKTLGKFGDYLVVNVSSPNTPGLRDLQQEEPIERLLSSVKIAVKEHCPHNPPVIVKIAPDLSDAEMEAIARVAERVGVDGVIISNTTVSRPSHLRNPVIFESGGLSGPPLKPLALEAVKKFYKLTNGKIPIIGCGGIKTAEDVLEYGKAGASLVQLYTSLGYEGPGIVAEIKENLNALLEKEKKTWKEIIGTGH